MLVFISTRSSHQRCSTKKLFLKFFAIVTRSTCAGVFSCEYCEIFRNTCLEEHLWTAASRVFLLEAVVQRCSVKKVFLKISQDSQENTCARVCFLNKVTSLTLQLYQKETLAPVFSNEFCEIFKNTFFLQSTSGYCFCFLVQCSYVFCKKDVKNFGKFTGKYLCQILRPATLLKKILQHKCFPVNFVKYL